MEIFLKVEIILKFPRLLSFQGLCYIPPPIKNEWHQLRNEAFGRNGPKMVIPNN